MSVQYVLVGVLVGPRQMRGTVSARLNGAAVRREKLQRAKAVTQRAHGHHRVGEQHLGWGDNQVTSGDHQAARSGADQV